KFSIGADIKQEVTHLIANIYRANCTQHKIILLGQARENVEMVRLYLRLLKDLKQVSLPKFIQLNEKIESISKQLSFWQKHASNVGSESQ
ncbi:MAG: four helix bundle protein, partial [Candidatus Falkowbacteria bacterium]